MPNPLIQKSPAPSTSTQSSDPLFFAPAVPHAPKAPSPPKEAPCDAKEPLSKKVQGLVKDLTEDKKMKGYLKSMGDKMEELAKDSVKDKRDDPAYADEVLASKRIAEEFEKIGGDILKDPDLKWVKERLVCFAGQGELQALVTAMTGAAVAYLADAPLKLEKDFKVGSAVRLGFDADLGTAKDPKLNHALGFSHMAWKHFALKMGVGYRSPEEGAKLAAPEDKDKQTLRLRTEMFANQDGLQINISPTIELKDYVRLSGTGAYSTQSGYFGKASLRLGTSAVFVDSGVFFKPDGSIVLSASTGKKFDFSDKSSLTWKSKFSRDLMTGATKADASLEFTQKDFFSLSVEGNLQLPTQIGVPGAEGNSINIFFRMPLQPGKKKR